MMRLRCGERQEPAGPGERAGVIHMFSRAFVGTYWEKLSVLLPFSPLVRVIKGQESLKGEEDLFFPICKTHSKDRRWGVTSSSVVLGEAAWRRSILLTTSSFSAK